MANGNCKPALPITDIDTLCQLAATGLDFRHWYRDARVEIAEVCAANGWDVKRFTCILALLSPRCSVRRNVRLALHYMEHGEYLDGVVIGVRRSVEHYERTGEIRGPKTSPFCQALLGDESAIVLDTWMAKALLCCEINPDSGDFSRVATRAAANDAVRHVAARFTVSAASAQAMIWGGIFREYGGNPIAFPIAEEARRFIQYGRSFPKSGYIPNEPLDVQASDDIGDF